MVVWKYRIYLKRKGSYLTWPYPFYHILIVQHYFLRGVCIFCMYSLISSGVFKIFLPRVTIFFLCSSFGFWLSNYWWLFFFAPQLIFVFLICRNHNQNLMHFKICCPRQLPPFPPLNTPLLEFACDHTWSDILSNYIRTCIYIYTSSVSRT